MPGVGDPAHAAGRPARRSRRGAGGRDRPGGRPRRAPPCGRPGPRSARSARARRGARGGAPAALLRDRRGGGRSRRGTPPGQSATASSRSSRSPSRTRPERAIASFISSWSPPAPRRSRAASRPARATTSADDRTVGSSTASGTIAPPMPLPWRSSPSTRARSRRSASDSDARDSSYQARSAGSSSESVSSIMLTRKSMAGRASRTSSGAAAGRGGRVPVMLRTSPRFDVGASGVRAGRAI